MYLALSLFLLQLTAVTASHQSDKRWNNHDGRRPRHACITTREAVALVETFFSFYVDIDPDLAERTLADDFTVYSDSVNFFSGISPGLPSTTSRDSFIAHAQADQSNPDVFTPTYNLTQIWHTCDEITFRYWLNFPIPIHGIDVITLQKGTYLIEVDYSEFDTAGVLVAFGLFPCPAAGTA